MKKSELRTGMLVETLNEEIYFVSLGGINNSDMLLNIDGGSFMPLCNIAYDLNALSSKSLNITKVYQPITKSLTLDIRNCDLIWKREEKVKEYTMNELIKKVGHEFKIKK